MTDLNNVPGEMTDAEASLRRLVDSIRQQGVRAAAEASRLIFAEAQRAADIRVEEAYERGVQVGEERMREARAAAEEELAERLRAVREGQEAAIAEAKQAGIRLGTTQTMMSLQEYARQPWDGWNGTIPDANGEIPLPLFLAAGEGLNRAPAYAPEDITLADVRALGECASWSPAAQSVLSLKMGSLDLSSVAFRPMKDIGSDSTIGEFLEQFPLAEFVHRRYVAQGVWGQVRDALAKQGIRIVISEADS